MSAPRSPCATSSSRARRMWSRTCVAATSAVCALVVIAGCNAVLGIGDPISAPIDSGPDVDAPSSLEAGSGVGFWSGPGDRGCSSARVPSAADRPASASVTVGPPIYLALQSMRFGSAAKDGRLDNGAWQELGFDLDGVCTGSDTCEGKDSPPGCNPTVPQISTDGHLCRDNTFGRLMYLAALAPELAKKYGLSDDAVNCALCVGQYNYLLRVSGYNGEANDDWVRVDLYPSPGLTKPLPWDCADPSWKDHPCFTPDEAFRTTPESSVAPRSGPDLNDAKLFDDAAYVRDGYLVVKLPDDFLFWFPGYTAMVTALPLSFHSGTLSGKLTMDRDGVWRVTDGTIGGRIFGKDLVKAFREVGLCEQDPNYALITDFVQKNLDVLGDGRNDATTTCDAMSAAVGFTAQQIVAGKLSSVEPLTECVLRGTASADAGAKDGN